METLIEAPQELSVIGEYDVVVLGGGPAGVSAAIAASRAGSRTALIERYGYLGGQATGGLVILLVGLTDGKKSIVKGICEETINKLQEIGAAKDIGSHVLFDPESMKFLFDSMIEENNITPYYHNFVSNTITAEHWISGVIIDGKSGRHVIKGKVFVDATGDADLAKYCNIPYDQENANNIKPVTLGFRVGGIDSSRIRQFIEENPSQYTKLIADSGISTRIGGWIETLHNGEAWFNIAHIEKIDATDTKSLTKAEIQGRKEVHKLIKTFKENLPGFENGYLIDTASQIGIRESRRILGLYQLTKEDIDNKFDDSIAKAPTYLDSGEGSFDIPYRSLISEHGKNIIFAGRSISVDHSLFDHIRSIPTCMATGQAAGVAASIAAQLEEPNMGYVQKVDTNELRKILLQQGALL